MYMIHRWSGTESKREDYFMTYKTEEAFLKWYNIYIKQYKWECLRAYFLGENNRWEPFSTI